MKKLLPLALAALAMLFSACSRTIETEASVMVVIDGAGAVEGENPVSVPAGGAASFRLALPDGTVYAGCDADASYENGVLTLPRVLYPATVTVKTVTDPVYVSFSLSDPTCRGTIVTNAAPGDAVLAGGEISVSAEPYEGYRFSGWSLGATAARGGKIVSRDADYTFTLTEDTALFANYSVYDASRLLHTLVYDANGGTHVENGTSLTYQEVDVTDFLLPNCLAERGYFSRDGYVLIEYNTKPDGSGDAYSLGSKIIPASGSESTTLYCIWAAESDPALFTFADEADGTLAVTAYAGSETTVVVPASVNGKAVTRVAKNAFVKKRFTTLVLPSSILNVEQGAFNGCPDLTTLYMFDNVEKIYDDSFTDLSNMEHFYLNAAMPPKYAASVEGNFSRKWERLVTTQDKNRVVVVAGSSSLYGLKTTQLEELFKGEYVVVNYGTNAGTASTFYMEVCSHFMHEGDILVQAPCPDSATQLGSNEITWRLFRGTEAYYNVFRLVDMRRYNRLFTALREFNDGRRNMGNSSYTGVSSGIDQYGDIATVYGLNADNYIDGGGGPTHWLNPNRINDMWAANLKDAHGKLKAAGVTVYFSYGISNRNSFAPASLTPEYIAKTDAGYESKLTVPRISTIADYIFEGKYLCNSNAHLGDEGRRIRTDRLYRDITVQMEKDGIPVP